MISEAFTPRLNFSRGTLPSLVEAANEEEAIELANENFGSLKSYAGMGGFNKLIGVPDKSDGRSILPDSEVEFDDCDPLS